MKKLFLIVSLIFAGMSISAQSVDDVTLVVSGDGTTKEEATHVALRSAVEQAYGVFVSANTEIMNDELVKDEIATVTSGNVKSYKELNCILLPNGNQMVTLEAVVSTKKLAAYAQSKGASCEFAGATFGANLRLLKLNQENTKKAFENLLQQCKAIAPYIVEPSLQVEDPTVDGLVPFRITLYSTPNLWEFSELIVTTLKALQINDEQLEALKQMKADLYPIKVIAINYDKNKYVAGEMRRSYTNSIYGDKYNLRIIPENNDLVWLWDQDDLQPFKEEAYFYAPFPYEKLDMIIENANKYYIADDQENNYDINFTQLIVGVKPYSYIYTDYSDFSRVYTDANVSCYYFNESRISLPYKYIKPYRDKKTKELVYPKKKLGEAIFTFEIPTELLINISKFEILRNED